MNMEGEMLNEAVDLRSHFLSPAVGMPKWPNFGNADDGEEEESPDSDDEESETDYEQELAAARSKVKAANAEAKKFRLRNKALNQQLREMKPGESRTQAERDAAVRERNELRVELAVLRQAMQHGVDPDVLETKLRKQRILDLDEDGDLSDDFEEQAAAIVKSMSAEKPKPPTSPTLSGGKNRGGASDSDRAAFARRFPALAQRPREM